jgi:hypothetical protein
MRAAGRTLRALAVLSLALRPPLLLGGDAGVSAAAPRPASRSPSALCGSGSAWAKVGSFSRLLLRLGLRGGGRRRKDWQSPRPGDSDEVFSTSDPEWSVAGESSALQCASSDDAVDDASDEASVSAASAWSSSDRERLKRRAERPHNHGRAQHGSRPSGRQARAAPAKSRSRVRPARHRRDQPTSEEWESEACSDAYASAQRPRRGPMAAADAGLRWGTQATDALDAALRGKLVATKPSKTREKAGTNKAAKSRRRLRREMADTSDDSVESRPSEPSTSSTAHRASSHRAGRAREHTAREFLEHLPIDADSRDHNARYANTVAAAPFQALRPLLSIAHNQSSSLSDAAPSPKGSPARTWPSDRSPQQHVQPLRGRIPAQEAAAVRRDSPRQSPGRDEGASEGYSFESENVPAEEVDGGVTTIDGEDAVEKVLRGLTDRLSCEGDAVFLPHGASRVWRGLAVSADGVGVRRSATGETVNSLTMSSNRNQSPLIDKGPESAFVIPVNTEVVLRGLGSVMSQAADALASVLQRSDLECAGLSDSLMGLAQRLDSARKEGEGVSALLQAPQCVFSDYDAANSARQSTLDTAEEELRCWRRRTVVSGVWHEMQKQSAAVAQSAKLQPARSCMQGLGAAAGDGNIIYVGGNHGMSDEEVQEMMSNFGRVVRIHSSDAYAFVEVSPPPTRLC